MDVSEESCPVYRSSKSFKTVKMVILFILGLDESSMGPKGHESYDWS